MKGIAREVHLTSVVQSELYEATRILFVRKENKCTTFFSFSTNHLLSVSPHQRSVILDITHQTQAAYSLFHLKYLKLCSEDEQSFYGVGTIDRYGVLYSRCLEVRVSRWPICAADFFWPISFPLNLHAKISH